MSAVDRMRALTAGRWGRLGPGLFFLVLIGYPVVFPYAIYEQGVLLLNNSLTVEEGRAGSHQNLGWEAITDAAVAAVAQRDEPAVFLLWGNHARRKAERVAGLMDGRHLVLEMNGGGNTWHFPSASGPGVRTAFGGRARMLEQLGAWRVIAEELVRRTRGEAV